MSSDQNESVSSGGSTLDWQPSEDQIVYRDHRFVTSSPVTRARGYLRVFAGSGILLALMLVILGAALAVALTSSTASTISLPSVINIGHGTRVSPPTTPSTTIATSPSNAVTSTTQTLNSTTTTFPTLKTPIASSSERQTTVVKPVSVVRVEDDHGRQIDSEVSESSSSDTSEHESSRDH